MERIVGVKFKNSSKVYSFAPAKDGETYVESEGVIVETAKGPEYGTVVFPAREAKAGEIVSPLKPILRKATRKDEELLAENERKIPEALSAAQKKADELGLPMKFVRAEFSFDGKKAVLFFSSENRVDFRELVKDLASTIKARIELRQIGIRDETKMLGGLGPCGRPCCCAEYLKDFKKVSIKMAKSQGLSLNPVKISGLCGRLMCCLDYENEYYSEVFKKMPKIGGAVVTPDGEGYVVNNDMLKLRVKVKILAADGSEQYKDFALEEVAPRGSAAPVRKADLPEEDEEDFFADVGESEAPVNGGDEIAPAPRREQGQSFNGGDKRNKHGRRGENNRGGENGNGGEKRNNRNSENAGGVNGEGRQNGDRRGERSGQRENGEQGNGHRHGRNRNRKNRNRNRGEGGHGGENKNGGENAFREKETEKN